MFEWFFKSKQVLQFEITALKAEIEAKDTLIKVLKEYKEIVDLQNSDDIKRLMEELHEADQAEEEKQRYCIGCNHAIINIFPRKKGQMLVCNLNARKICKDFQPKEIRVDE